MDEHTPLRDSDLPREGWKVVGNALGTNIIFVHLWRDLPRDHSTFELSLCLRVNSVEELHEWLLKTTDTGVTWRVSITRPRKGHTIIFKTWPPSWRNKQGSPSRLVSAIHYFGKSHISPAANSAAALEELPDDQALLISCQPTAVARRSTKAGTKRRLTTGRPKSQNSGSEHPYCSHAKRKRPSEIRHHKLSDSVYANSSHPK